MSSMQGVRIDSATRERLAALAALRNRSSHWLVRQAIEDFLDREERYEREKREDLEEWENYLLTGNGVSGDSVETWLKELASGRNAPCPK